MKVDCPSLGDILLGSNCFITSNLMSLQNLFSLEKVSVDPFCFSFIPSTQDAPQLVLRNLPKFKTFDTAAFSMNHLARVVIENAPSLQLNDELFYMISSLKDTPSSRFVKQINSHNVWMSDRSLTWGQDLSLVTTIQHFSSKAVHYPEIHSIDFSIYKNLQTITISDFSFPACHSFRVSNLNKLNVLSIGSRCFSFKFFSNYEINRITDDEVTDGDDRLDEQGMDAYDSDGDDRLDEQGMDAYDSDADDRLDEQGMDAYNSDADDRLDEQGMDAYDSDEDDQDLLNDEDMFDELAAGFSGEDMDPDDMDPDDMDPDDMDPFEEAINQKDNDLYDEEFVRRFRSFRPQVSRMSVKDTRYYKNKDFYGKGEFIVENCPKLKKLLIGEESCYFMKSCRLESTNDMIV